MEFSRQGYWSGLPLPTPEELPDPGIEPESLVSSALADRFFNASATREAQLYIYIYIFLSVCVCIYIYIYIFIYMCVCVCVCVCVFFC